MTMDIKNDMYKHYGSSVQNFSSLGALEEDILLCVSRVSSKESWRTFLIPEWCLDDYDYGCQDLFV